MGQVYAAVDDVLGREVAIKTLKTATGFAARMLDERFRQEARAIAQLSHPGIVQVFDLDLASEPPYLVMERVAGPSLAERLQRGPLPADELVPLAIQIARALAAAHAVGVVHRDVKPANILACGNGAWKLADFGVAHVPDSSLTITGQFVGSPAYAPPEALVKGIAAPPNDVYGLGATLYEAAAGSWPRGDSPGALLAPPPPLRELAPHLPAGVAAAIDRAVAFEAAHRPSAGELADRIARAIDHAPVTMPVPVWKPWALGGFAAAVVLAIVVAMQRHTPPVATLRDMPELPAFAAPPPHDLGGKAARDWSHLVDELRRGRVGGARKRLDDFERKWGTTAETRALRDELDALPEEEEDGRDHHEHEDR
jgi:serine/threonine-protein kinase